MLIITSFNEKRSDQIWHVVNGFAAVYWTLVGLNKYSYKPFFFCFTFFFVIAVQRRI